MAKQKHDNNEEPESKSAGNPSSDLMTTKDLMEYLMVSRTKVWELVHKKGLPAFRIGGDYRYRRTEVDKWIDGQRFVPEGESDQPA